MDHQALNLRWLAAANTPILHCLLQSSSSTVRLPRTKSALFKVTSNKAQESQLFSEIGLLEADLTSTRKDLYAANVRTKSLTSVLKDRTGKMQALEDRVASHDELFKVSHTPSPPSPPCHLSITDMQQVFLMCLSLDVLCSSRFGLLLLYPLLA